MQPITLGWVAIAALLVGAVVRLLKSDSLTVALANLGLPPIPKRVLPWLSLVLGVASAILDVKLQGTAWPEAVAKGLIAGVAAIAGHELGVESMRKGKELLALAVVLMVGSTACTPQARWAVADLLASKIACAVAHQDLTTEQIVVQCAIEPQDVDRIMAIVGESRTASAKAAADASARAGMCPGDAGAEGGAR